MLGFSSAQLFENKIPNLFGQLRSDLHVLQADFVSIELSNDFHSAEALRSQWLQVFLWVI